MTSSSVHPRSLPFDQWPRIDREAWQIAVQTGDPFSTAGPASHWRSTTRQLVLDRYGEWLAFLANSNKLNPQLEPAARISRETVRAYVEHSKNHLRSATIVFRLECLAKAIRVISPEADVSWLWQVARHFGRECRDRKPKLHRIRPSAEIYRLGIKLMHDAELDTLLSLRRSAALFRDGLMIAMLAARPIRAATFTALDLDDHVTQRGDVIWLDIPGQLTKTGDSLEVPLPADLTSYFNRYTEVYRLTLLDNDRMARLWISQSGAPMTRVAINSHICLHTKRQFGVSISPHLFRDCAATSIAIEDPDHVNIAALLLGHRSLRTTERHYNQAQMLHAGRQLTATISRLRGPLQRANRRIN